MFQYFQGYFIIFSGGRNCSLREKRVGFQVTLLLKGKWHFVHFTPKYVSVISEYCLIQSNSQNHFFTWFHPRVKLNLNSRTCIKRHPCQAIGCQRSKTITVIFTSIKRSPLLSDHPLLSHNGLFVSSSTCMKYHLKSNHSNENKNNLSSSF